MKSSIIQVDLTAKIERKKVLELLQFNMDETDSYDIQKEIDAWEQHLLEYAKPAGVFIRIEGKDAGRILGDEGVTDAISMMYTIGGKADEISGDLFSSGSYFSGIVVNAMADSLLFHIQEQMLDKLREYCSLSHIGVKKCLEAQYGEQDRVCQRVYDLLHAEKTLGIKLTAAGMLSPVKSMYQTFLVTTDRDIFQVEHDCSSCMARANCTLADLKILPIHIRYREKTRTIWGKRGQNLLELLRENGISIPAPCGGKGICKKCRVLIEDAETLACRTVIDKTYHITVLLNEESMTVVTEGREHVIERFVDIDDNKEVQQKGGCILAVDIGTTTLAMQLYRKGKQEPINTWMGLNHQRSLGADVISRIQASNEGKGEILQRLILHDIQNGIRALISASGGEIITEIIIAGNTTMIHLLMGYNCETLGVYPFTPVNTHTITGQAKDLLGMVLPRCTVTILPGVSAFVGGDITAGLVACHFYDSQRLCFFLDLGTNGEMAIGNHKRILTASAAAGPAFEGGNIACGTGSIPGAICHAAYIDGRIQVETIGDKPPIGICGTGVVDITAELLKNGKIEETGNLTDEFNQEVVLYEDTDQRIVLTQNDIREIQMAKAAIRAGISALILSFGVKEAEIDHVYLAGGFGYTMDEEKAITLGLFPEEFRGKIHIMGNTSLKGAAICGHDPGMLFEAQRLTNLAEEFSLAEDTAFQDLYIKHMFFT